jgi:hypothetical protein
VDRYTAFWPWIRLHHDFEHWFVTSPQVLPLLGWISWLNRLVSVAFIVAVAREDIAVATALSYLYRYVGQVVGVAVSSAFLQGILTSQLRRRITGPGATEVCHLRTLCLYVRNASYPW